MNITQYFLNIYRAQCKQEVRVGVVHGTAETRALLERMRAGDPEAQCVFTYNGRLVVGVSKATGLISDCTLYLCFFSQVRLRGGDGLPRRVHRR